MKANGKIWILFDTVYKKQTKPLSTLDTQKVLLKLKITDRTRYLLWTPGWDQWASLKDFLDSDQRFFVIAPAPIPGTLVEHEDGRVDTVKTKTNITIVTLENEKTVLVEKVEPARDKEKSYTEILIGDHNADKKTDYGYFYDDFNAEKIDINAQVKKIKLPDTDKANSNIRSFRERAIRHEFKIEITLITKNGKAFRSFSKNISTSGTLLEDEIPKDFLNTQFDLIIVNKFEKDQQKGRLHFQGKIVGDYEDPRRLTFLDPDKELIKKLEALLNNYVSYQKKSVS